MVVYLTLRRKSREGGGLVNPRVGWNGGGRKVPDWTGVLNWNGSQSLWKGQRVIQFIVIATSACELNLIATTELTLTIRRIYICLKFAKRSIGFWNTLYNEKKS